MAITCGECGSKRLEIREDKDNVIGYAFSKPMYAKLYVCKDCTNTWSSADDEGGSGEE